MTLDASERPELVEQVTRLTRVDPAVLERVRHEALTVPTDWKQGYGQYQSGGWWTLSLLNDTGDPADVTIKDCNPIATRLLAAMPATQAFLSSLGLRYMWARIARLSPNSFLWEHRDYENLTESNRVRLHVPLVTNSSAFLVTGGMKIHLSAGHLWRLRPTHAHGACNLAGPDRFHLLLDCYIVNESTELSTAGPLGGHEVVSLATATSAELDRECDTARSLARLGYVRAAERHLLRQFYEYALPEGHVYDLISSIHADLGRSTDAAEWQAKKSILLRL